MLNGDTDTQMKYDIELNTAIQRLNIKNLNEMRSKWNVAKKHVQPKKKNK